MNKKLFIVSLAVAALSFGIAKAQQITLVTYGMGASLGTPTQLNGFTGAGAFTSTRGTLGSSTISGAGNAVTTTGWTPVGGEWKISLNLTGYQNISITGWSQMASNTGPRDFQVRVSYDGGTTFSNIGSPYTIQNGNSAQGGFSLSSLADNNPSVIVSWYNYDTTSVNGGTTASSGTSRFSTFSVLGVVAVPEPHEYGLAIAALLGVAVVVRRRRRALTA